MNTISIQNIRKKFAKETIFNNISFEAHQGDIVAITGYNGSGKSTLLQIIAGYVTPTNGNINYFFNNKNIDTDHIYKYISLAAPYQELIEEFTLTEMISFYKKFKLLSNSQPIEKIIESSHTGFSVNKQIKHYSSGMKQRLKLALALMTEIPCLLLDEPHSNLDHQGIEWFRKLMIQFKNDKIIFISSNRIEEETGFCNKFINLEEYKNS